MNHSIIPIILSIDVEPDGRLIPRYERLHWDGFEGCYPFFSELRQNFREITGSPVHFTWFYRADPQINDVYGAPEWAFKYYRRFLNDFIEHGDEIGLHPHAYRWLEDKKDWLVDHADQAWVEHCIAMSLSAYQFALGKNCVTFRFGERWMNTETMNYIEKQGILYDLTPEPGLPSIPYIVRGERHTGMLPDYTNVSVYPYRPSAHNFQIPDTEKESGLWVLPVSMGKLTYQFGRMEKMYRRITAPGLLKSQPIALSPALPSRHFIESIERIFAEQSRTPIIMTLRTDSGINNRALEYMKENFDYLMTHPLREQFRFVTPAEGIAIFENKEISGQAAKAGTARKRQFQTSDRRLQSSLAKE